MGGKLDPFSITQKSDPKGDLNGKYRHAWTEEALDVEGGKLGTAHTRRFLGSSLTKKRLTVFVVIMVLASCFVVGRVFYLQIVRGPEYRTLAEQNRVRLRPVPAERGILFDVNGRELVQNVPTFKLGIVPQDLPRSNAERARILERLTKAASTTLPELEDSLREYKALTFDSITIKENLDYEEALKLFIEQRDLPGVVVEAGSKRFYLFNTPGSPVQTTTTQSLSHVLGYLGKLSPEELETLRTAGYRVSDKIGKTGIEKIYETELRGRHGQKKIEVDALGKEQTVLAIDPPTPGKNLYLTIDLAAEAMLEKLVRDTAIRTNKGRIAAVALNPENGAILAMVSWPAFDNNDFSGGITQNQLQSYLENKNNPLFNRVIAGLYPPGSTAKIMVAAAALEEGVVNEQTTVVSAGGITVGGHFFKDWRAGGHGTVNVVSALAWSVNTYFYYVGGGYQKFSGLGFDRLYKYFSAFRINELTGIDLPGERSGFIPTPAWKLRATEERWYAGDTYNISIGQGGLLVNPLTVARWTAAVANGGQLVTPHVADHFFEPATNSSTALIFPWYPLTGVSQATLSVVKKGMRECVNSGSCQLLKTLPITSAGKTGTAQWSNDRLTHAWFTAFAPLDSPKIVVTVLVEEGGEGSVIAMPIARDFLAWWANAQKNSQ